VGPGKRNRGLRSRMNYLITGGCGFIGVKLIRRLMAEDEAPRIRVIDNLTVGTRNDLGSVCDFADTNSPVANSDKVDLWVAIYGVEIMCFVFDFLTAPVKYVSLSFGPGETKANKWFHPG